MTHLKLFALIVYNHYSPRNWDMYKMDKDLAFVISALVAMGEG